ncbi:hypothetical protein Aple_047800 [Acrocarpospora pleiomorpha]|uniref:Uncharacterized protein n=2 Tax=Acrocarpospora pleiomorpha TaxID=90975 RepID=A0A5M3XRS0_9ACTN|nr:hypothetical protein Aple_047800 [Acrocarpospora pleiomorpha]
MNAKKKNPRQPGTDRDIRPGENNPQPHQRRPDEMPGQPNSKPGMGNREHGREPGSRDTMPPRRQGS